MDKANVGFDTPIGFKYVFKDLVSTVTNLVDGMAEVVLTGSNEWNELYFTPGSGKWLEEPTEGRAGIAYNQSASVVCPKETIPSWNELNEMATRKVLVKLTFKEGVKLIGTLTNAVRLVVKTDTSNGSSVVVSFEKTGLNAATEKSRWIEDGSGE